MFSYPFDGGKILRKRKSLKRKLLAQPVTRLKKKIAVLGGSTTTDIVLVLELFLLDHGIEAEFYESEYGQYWQDGMFPPDALLKFNPDIIFVHTTNRNISAYPSTNSSKAEADAALSAEFGRYRALWENLHKVFNRPIIQNNFEPPHYRLLGNRDAYDCCGRVNFINRLNDLFCEYAAQHSGFYINDINWLASYCGLKQFSKPGDWYLYKYAFSVACIPEFAFNLANIIKSVFGKNKRVLALDLDNTLWGGTVGDDGAENLEIGQETPIGQAYRDFQSYIKAHKDIGVVLAVNSKNERESALSGLNHPDGVLKPDDFLVIKANWDIKSDNIEEIAKELNVLTDSVVFIDDNPVEREIVKTACGFGAAVPEMTAVEEYIGIIDRNGYFEATSVSREDINRVQMYRDNLERAEARNGFSDYGEFLKSLDMEAVVEDFSSMYYQRISQLTNKSNQFNVTTKRYTVSEIEECAVSDAHIAIYGQLNDKFGCNGIVSVVIGEIKGECGDELHIDLFIMSCRVLKRDMEFAMIDVLAEKASHRGVKRIYGYYYPTPKNKIVADLFDVFGFRRVEDGKWELDIADYGKKNRYIKVNGVIDDVLFELHR